MYICDPSVWEEGDGGPWNLLDSHLVNHWVPGSVRDPVSNNMEKDKEDT